MQIVNQIMNKEKNDKNCVDLVFVTGEFVDSF